MRHWLLDFQYELRDQFKKHGFVGGLSGGVVNDDWTIGLRTCCNHKLNRGVGPDREIEGWCGDKCWYFGMVSSGCLIKGIYDILLKCVSW